MNNIAFFIMKLLIGKTTSTKRLIKWSESSDNSIRALVARNSNTPIDVRIKLSEDTSEWVRDAVAGNPNTLDKIVSKLCKDDNEFVREQAKEERARRKNK